MQNVDERIMEYLGERGWLTPSILAGETGIHASEERIRERLIVLCHAGFAAPATGEQLRDVYDGVVITKVGMEYLEGEVDARHHRPPPRAHRDIGRPTVPPRWSTPPAP